MIKGTYFFKGKTKLLVLLSAVGTMAVAAGFCQVPALTGARYTNGNFEFGVQGESKGRYLILASSNATHWIAIATNQALNATRSISIPASSSAALFKAQQVPAPNMGFALLATERIDLKFNSIRIDSYDSGDPNFSTNGQYDPLKQKDNGDVACAHGPLNLGNADVLGRVWVGTGGQLFLGPNSGVGTAAWLLAGNTGVMPGYVRNDLAVAVPPVSAPFTGGGFAVSFGVVGGDAYDYVLGNGNYRVNGSLSMGSNDKMLVLGSNTVLYVTGDFSLSGHASIILQPGASLALYVGGTNGSIGGIGINNPGSPANFRYFGLPTHTTVAINADLRLKGIIYTPNAVFNMSSGSGATNEIFGAVVAKTITASGNVLFHYDEALQRLR